MDTRKSFSAAGFSFLPANAGKSIGLIPVYLISFTQIDPILSIIYTSGEQLPLLSSIKQTTDSFYESHTFLFGSVLRIE